MPFRGFGLAAGALLAASCQSNTPARGILDAADIYEANSEAVALNVEALRKGVPDVSVRKDLARHFSVEQVAFRPADDLAPDMAWITLETRGERAVGLIFMGSYDPNQLAVFTGRTFESCDADAEKAAENPPPNVTSIYCRIDENWLAFELIEERAD